MYHCIYCSIFCMRLFNFVNHVVFCYVTYSYCHVFYCSVYIFLLLCMVRFVYSLSLRCSVYCLCVNVYCTAATGCQPNFV